MTVKKRKKVGGGKLSRSETVTVRLDPKLRYFVELAARKQRRTVSSYIEWALEDSLRSATLIYNDVAGRVVSVDSERNVLWDIEESDRLAKLAFRYPDLLSHREQRIWKVVSENKYFWHVHSETGRQWRIEEDNFSFQSFRQNWSLINAFIDGKVTESYLPKHTEDGDYGKKKFLETHAQRDA